MNVHMVTQWKGKRKLTAPWPRLVHYLQKYLGWSASHDLDHLADANYILTYTVGWRKYAHPWEVWRAWGGPLVCRIGERPPYGLKARLWDEGVKGADLRLTEAWSFIPMLAQYGPSERMMLFPVNRDLFVIAERPRHERPTIGVVGYCVPTGRKGQVLIKELAQYPDAQQWRIKAAGAAWPVKTKEYRYEELPCFYQSLDIHLCPTISQDSPTSPFEALACGVPVVLPRGVPLLDELPEMRGIYRYEQGNFDAMYEALKQCAADLGTHDREALRAITQGMTVEVFCEEHRVAFEKHFGNGADG